MCVTYVLPQRMNCIYAIFVLSVLLYSCVLPMGYVLRYVCANNML